jgi:hypothetical protein
MSTFQQGPLWSVNLTNFPNKKNAIIDTQYAYIGLPDKPLSADDPENAFKGKCSEIRKNLDAHTFTIDTKNFTLKTEELMQDVSCPSFSIIFNNHYQIAHALTVCLLMNGTVLNNLLICAHPQEPPQNKISSHQSEKKLSAK